MTSAKIKLACSIALGQELLSYHLAQFKLLHPTIDISITLLERSIDIFREDFDLVLVIENVHTRTVDLPNSLKRCVLFSYCYHLYARQKYIESNPVLKAGELTSASLGALALLSLERARTSSDTWSLLSADKVGINIPVNSALLTEYFMEPEFSELSKVFPHYCTEKETLVATYLDNKPVTPAISRLVDYLSKALSV
ncbi:MAG: LysR substrate-binding domain-containing protein [Thalassotalea sp.]|nr:LysR substrate-binding domain-containing protein [Thalassotalea sp.]